MALRQLAVLTIVSLLLRSEGNQCLNGFAAIDTLVDKAASVGKLVRREKQQRIFPAINFSCSAAVSGWIFVAEGKEGRGRNLYPEIQIWRTANARQYSVLHTSSQQPTVTESSNVFRYPVISVQVQPGDILGVYQPEGKKSRYTLTYQEHGGPINYRMETKDAPTTFSIDGNGVHTDQNDYPLVGVEISNPACLHGFLSIGALRAKGKIRAGSRSGVVERDGQQRIFPSINFSCNGMLKKWTFAAEEKPAGVMRNANSHFQIWRKSSSTNYNRVGSSTVQPQRTSDLNVYEYLPNPPLNFHVGDILGVYQPAADSSMFGAYYQLGNGPTNYRIENQVSEAVSFGVNNEAVRSDQSDLPLVTVEISVDCGLPPSPEHGSVDFSSTTMGSRVTYNCNFGYVRIGPLQRVCLATNGQWSDRTPTCMRIVDCGTVQDPENGWVNISGVGEAATAEYHCRDGYRLVNGSKTRRCGEDSQWIGTAPTCQGARCHWDGLGSGGEQICNSMSLPDVSKVTPPQQGSPGLFQLVIGAVIALLSIAILFMCGTVLLLYIWRKKHKSTAANVSVENPTYTGDSSTLNPQSCIAKEKAGLQEDQQRQVEETRMDGPHLYDSADMYDQPIRIAINGGNPQYEMASLTDTKHHYELSNVGDSPHYEMASLNSPYEVPVSPYEIPTPSAKASNIYGSMLWGTYVPTEEQRRLSCTSSVGVYMTPSCRSDQQLTFFEESEIYWKPASDSASLYEQLAKNKYREILRHQIQITEHLGSGQFGMVDKGLWQSPGETVEVAVKTLKPGSNENDRVKFLQEAAINGQFQHPNVVKLHGVVTVGEPVMIVLEFLVNGDLRDYLIKNRPVPGEMVPSNWPGLLLGFCKDIASGMEYLARKAFVHRDLAARNILVAEDRVCKISDFGLSRDLEEESYYISNGGKVPVKWTAPEALHFKKYSTASDVWSYGAVMYEIWSLGHKPFEGYTNLQTIKAIDQDIRLQPPPGCPRMVYSIMIQCWHPETSSRPTFTRLLQALSSPVTEILMWTEEDMRVHPQAVVLGASLEAGKDLYPELQRAYFHIQQHS